MPKVRMKNLAAGPRGPWEPGRVVEVGDEEASQLVAGGYAEVIEEAVAERATAPKGEKATARKPTGKKAASKSGAKKGEGKAGE